MEILLCLLFKCKFPYTNFCVSLCFGCLSLSFVRSFVRPLTRTLSPLFVVPFFFSSCLSPLRSLLILFNFKLFSTFPSFSFKPIHFALLSHIVIIDSSNIAVFLISNGKLNHFHQSFFVVALYLMFYSQLFHLQFHGILSFNHSTFYSQWVRCKRFSCFRCYTWIAPSFCFIIGVILILLYRFVYLYTIGFFF